MGLTCQWIPSKLGRWTEKDDSLSFLFFSGTGHSCVYPLLGCRLNATWKFTATDIDERALEFAQKNVTDNQLGDRIVCLLNANKDLLLLPVTNANPTMRFAFCMCNPPFYESWEQVRLRKELKLQEPSAVCQGTENEMLTEGGEVEFVKKMIHESMTLRERIGWYTTKIGIKASLRELVEELEKFQVLFSTLPFCFVCVCSRV